MNAESLNVLMPLAPGAEEMEAVILADCFRRVGWSVTLAGIAPGPVTASRGVVLTPDADWDDLDPAAFDLLVLPGGGGGTEALCAHEGVRTAIQAFVAAAKPVAAICAAPRVLDRAGVLADRRYTCYPGVEQHIGTGIHVDQVVVEDGPLITSRGPGTAFDLALHLVRAFKSPDAARALRAELCLH